MVPRFLIALGILASGAAALSAGEPQRAAVDAFDRHVKQVETARAGQPLWVDGASPRRDKVKAGDLLVEPRTGKGLIEIPGGLIHDWIGTVFVPGVSLDQVLALVQDYNRHKSIYPEVVESKLLHRDGDHFQIYLRLKRKQVITVVLDSDHEVQYTRLSRTSARSTSYTTRLAEVDKAGTAAERVLPPSAAHGYLWRLHTFWRFEEQDQGVFIECEAISLTRNVPSGLGWLIEPVIRDLPGQSLERTLEATKKALKPQN